MGDFLLGVFFGVVCSAIAFILTDALSGTGAQAKHQQALITQCELKLTRDKVCVLQAVPELEINK